MINNHHQPQGSWGSIPNNHHSSHSLSIMFPFFPIIYPLFSHSLLIIWIISTIKNWISRWFSHQFPIKNLSNMDFPWFSRDFPMIFPRFSGTPGGRADHRPPLVLRPVDLQRRRSQYVGDGLHSDQHHIGGVDVAGEHPLFEGKSHGSLAKWWVNRL